MVDLKKLVQDTAEKFNTKFKELGEHSFVIDIPLKLKDGSFRYQYVYSSFSKGFAKGKDCFYVYSRCGTYSNDLNLYSLLKEAKFGVYSMVTILSDKDSEGNPVESVIVQASPIVEYTTYDELFYVICEVAEVADLLEEKYFGVDKN